MPASPLDSALYRDLLGDREVGALFTDSAEVRAMLIVEGALAKVQGAAGMIPQVSGGAIHRASLEIQIDPAGLAEATGRNAVPVPALVEAFRAEMNAPEHAQFVHWGATSQDIMDTALALRLRQALGILEGRLATCVTSLGQVAEKNADLPMVGRTYGQAAVPTSFGAVVAAWGAPLLAQHGRLAAVRGDVQQVSLSGAAGTLSAMGDHGPQIRAALAEALGLSDPGRSWHSTRDGIATLAGWLTVTCGALGKMGEDLIRLSQSGIGEVRLGQGGGSSTMPQKSNPVGPSVLVAIAGMAAGLNATLQGAMVHGQQRDAGAWIAEWMSLPQLVLLTARALATGQALAETMAPVPEAMARNLDDGLGLIHAEALTFALTRSLPRPEAAAAVKALCAEARESGMHLRELAVAAHGDDIADLFGSAQGLGTAPAEARAFATSAAALRAG